MGIVEARGVDVARPIVAREVVRQLKKAGIATSAVAALDDSGLHQSKVEGLLTAVVEALEASPIPRFEWKGLARLLDDEQLAALLNVSSSSLKRYESGERATPDAVAARLHFLALVVSDLAGSYNDVGIRRWFKRKRTRLDGRSPEQVLVGDWEPEDARATAVRELARELVSMSAT
jgi:transcriptional regulator with XRE-family HTH domain